ncbi:MAG: homoserine kinase [Endomicrobiales bacterium]|jgi:homoserine kinase
MNIKIRIPATTANLGPGFDTLGAALKLYNDIHITHGPASCIEIDGEGAGILPTGTSNVVWQAMTRILGKKYPFGSLRIRLINRIPLSSGLGSSAAARLGGLLAAYAVTGKKYTPAEVLAVGVRLEGHPDNIVPALAGGICAAVDGPEISYVRLDPPPIKAVICHPAFELPTEKARRLLPAQVPIADAVYNISRTALFMAAITARRYDCLRVAMDDRLHQPYRKKLIPGMDEVFSAARRKGAYGVAISGAGPSLIALADPSQAPAVAAAMQKAWKTRSIASRTFIFDFDTAGARVVITP